MGLLRWIGDQRRWRQEHVAAFEAVSRVESDGLTTFQHLALDAVAKFVSADEFKRIAMGKEPGDYLIAALGTSGFELYIYPNEASIFGRKPHAWFEEWDYKTPDELFAALETECGRRVPETFGKD